LVLAAGYTPGDTLNHSPMDVFTQTLVFGPSGRPAGEFVEIPDVDKFFSAVQRHLREVHGASHHYEHEAEHGPEVADALQCDDPRLEPPDLSNSQRSALR
jgi:hypothetical protein